MVETGTTNGSKNISLALENLSLLETPPPPAKQTQEMPASILRQWRPQAQRNLRNQWSKLSTLRHNWVSLSSSARSLATSLVNSYLSISYMDAMELGVLSDMPNIREKACHKLTKQLGLERSQLLSSYKTMVAAVVDMVNLSRSMRWFLKAASGSPLVQFSSTSENSDDAGDGGGIPVFKFLSVHAFEMLAEEVVKMFKLELILKIKQLKRLSWADELYNGETYHLKLCELYSEETVKPVFPHLDHQRVMSSYLESDQQPTQEVLQVYLTTWLAEVNIDSYRVEEIFATVSEEMGTSFL